jgi:hypothetical protein
MTGSDTDETWDSWRDRLSDTLAGMGSSDWVTMAVRPGVRAPDPTPSKRRSRWRRRNGADPSATRPVPPDVFVQARLVTDRLALECIGDTEWEGLTDLTEAQQRELVALGWHRDGDDPTFSLTYDPAANPWAEAAALLTTSLRDVLGATTPTDIDLRRSQART